MEGQIHAKYTLALRKGAMGGEGVKPKYTPIKPNTHRNTNRRWEGKREGRGGEGREGREGKRGGEWSEGERRGEGGSGGNE